LASVLVRQAKHVTRWCPTATELPVLARRAHGALLARRAHGACATRHLSVLGAHGPVPSDIPTACRPAPCPWHAQALWTCTGSDDTGGVAWVTSMFTRDDDERSLLVTHVVMIWVDANAHPLSRARSWCNVYAFTMGPRIRIVVKRYCTVGNTHNPFLAALE